VNKYEPKLNLRDNYQRNPQIPHRKTVNGLENTRNDKQTWTFTSCFSCKEHTKNRKYENYEYLPGEESWGVERSQVSLHSIINSL